MGEGGVSDNGPGSGAGDRWPVVCLLEVGGTGGEGMLEEGSGLGLDMLI